VAHYYACKFGLNRIDGDIRQKAAITAVMENVVIAIYRLRPIQLLCTNCTMEQNCEQPGFEPASAQIIILITFAAPEASGEGIVVLGVCVCVTYFCVSVCPR